MIMRVINQLKQYKMHFKHYFYCSNVRTRQLGENTLRRPEIIDNKRTYKSVILDKIGELLTKGPDRSPKPYTP